ncbi:hypothetical protein V8F06_012118, partial [Rhypophila decipiens]
NLWKQLPSCIYKPWPSLIPSAQARLKSTINASSCSRPPLILVALIVTTLIRRTCLPLTILQPPHLTVRSSRSPWQATRAVEEGLPGALQLHWTPTTSSRTAKRKTPTPHPLTPQTAFAVMDPQQFQALMMQAMTDFSSGLGNLGDTLANLTSQRTPYKDDRPPTYAVSKLQSDASFQEREDWMICTQRGRSPQEFYRKWAALVRRLPGMEVDSTFMARDYWIKLDRFYHNRYAEAVSNVTSAKECAEWCERIGLARGSSRNGLERDAHRKRPGSPVSLQDARKLPRTPQLPQPYLGIAIPDMQGDGSGFECWGLAPEQLGEMPPDPGSHLPPLETADCRGS